MTALTNQNLLKRATDLVSRVLQSLQFAAPLLTRRLVGIAILYTATANSKISTERPRSLPTWGFHFREQTPFSSRRWNSSAACV